MSHIPNSAMPHAMAEEPAAERSSFDASEWKAWADEQIAWGREQLAPMLERGREQIGPMVDKVRNDPKLIAAIVGTLALAAIPLLRSRRRHRHAFA